MTNKEKLEVLEILKKKPFILQKIFENKGLEPNAQKNYDGDYFWGTIDEEEYQKVKEWLEKKDEHTPSK